MVRASKCDACAIVQVLARKVKVELLERVADTPEAHGALPSDDLDGGSQVLKLGTFSHIRDRESQLCSRDNGEVSGDHVDGGLVRAGRA